MSGGHFDYKQYHISEIADSIEHELEIQGKEKPKESYYGSTYYDDYPDERYYYTYPENVQEKMREAVRHLRIAAIYAKRVDWLLCGDDGEESFLRRLDEELNNLYKNGK